MDRKEYELECEAGAVGGRLVVWVGFVEGGVTMHEDVFLAETEYGFEQFCHEAFNAVDLEEEEISTRVKALAEEEIRRFRAEGGGSDEDGGEE